MVQKRTSFIGTVDLIEEPVRVGGELLVVLEEEAVRRVRVELQPRVRQQPRQQVRIAREDHRVAIAVRDEDRQLDPRHTLQECVVRDAPAADVDHADRPHSFEEGLATANAYGGDVQQVTSSPTFDHLADWGRIPPRHSASTVSHERERPRFRGLSQ
jgi:hypothetical protein